ncbi:hypothetical protein GIB67_009820 [Kingdonia uniflora]|uniref:EamA domain-containing protein n=1 Tax=Kingdonia uniflora TaxID=39325 RepID=A0A7J7MH90_9MAGN|nr:hypothetical protein GIB67_009820 [Kingdonia uniflora]
MDTILALLRVLTSSDGDVRFTDAIEEEPARSDELLNIDGDKLREMSAMRDVSATETAIIYGLEPVWGAGFAWFFLGERWGITGWIGAAFILGGSLTVQILGAASPMILEKTERSLNKMIA